MLIKMLDITIYGETGSGWHTESDRNPSWDDIEVAIRRLDRFRYPFVWLYREIRALEEAEPDFTVIGGEGEFAADCLADGIAYRLCDPSRGDDMIVIWRSDQ